MNCDKRNMKSGLYFYCLKLYLESCAICCGINSVFIVINTWDNGSMS